MVQTSPHQGGQSSLARGGAASGECLTLLLSRPHFTLPFLSHQKANIAASTPTDSPISSPNSPKSEDSPCNLRLPWKTLAWNIRPCSKDHTAAKSLEIRFALPSLDGIAGERIQGIQACSRPIYGLCLYSRRRRHRRQHGNHHDSVSDLLRAGPPRHGRLGRLRYQHSATRDARCACVDSPLRRKNVRILSHAPRYHALMRCKSGPAVINWSMNPTSCTISIKAHAVISS